MSKIFISYRRDDSSGYAQSIYRELVQHFSKDRVFMDVDTVEPGVDFVDVIEKAVGECDVLVALIGNRWANVRKDAKSPLDDPNDFVRLEISTALARDIRVIPVLVDGMTMPSPETLPVPLKPLSRRNAIEISHTRFNYDVEQLTTAIGKVFDATEARRKANEENQRPMEEDRANQERLRDRLGEQDARKRVPEWRPERFIQDKRLLYVGTAAVIVILVAVITSLFMMKKPGEETAPSLPPPPIADQQQTTAPAGKRSDDGMLHPDKQTVRKADVPSTNIDKPTLLNSNEIRGSGVGEQISYYYTFNAGPGEVKVTVDGKNKGGKSTSAINVEISDLDAKRLLYVNMGYTTLDKRKVGRFQLGRRQQVIMRILLDEPTLDYMVRLEGTIDFSPTTKAQSSQ